MKMYTKRVFAVLGLALSTAFVVGCSSQGSMSQADMDAIKKHTKTEMPPEARAQMGEKMKEGQDLYQKRLREAGMSPAGPQGGAPPAGPGAAGAGAPGSSDPSKKK